MKIVVSLFDNLKPKKMINLGSIYFTDEYNSDGEILKHNGLNKKGIGRSNDNVRRFHEHHNRGSKASVGIHFSDVINCDEVGISDKIVERKLHKTVLKLGFKNIDRTSHYEENILKSTTEVFSGKANKDVEGVCRKGDQLTDDLLLNIIKNIYNVDLFKDQLTPLPHQVSGYNWMMDLFGKGYKDVLFNWKPRTGKSFLCYHYMIENPQDILLFTNFPILNNQWKSEFEMLRGHNYNIIVANELDGKKIILDKSRPNFTLISLQDGKGDDKSDKETDTEIIEGLKKAKFSQIKNHKWGTIIFDEIHKGKETPKTDKLLEGLKYDRMIGLSATPTKNILRGTFSLLNTHRYTLIDESKMKELYPNLYKNPTIKNYLFNIDDDVRQNMRYFEENENFTFSKFLETNDGSLVYKNDIISLYSWLFSKGKFNKKDNLTHNIINKCKSILMFVEHNNSQEHIANILKDLVGDTYDVYFTNSDVNNSRQLLRKIRKDYIPKNGKKVIIIANKQLTTGITLKYCDLVLFMNDWKSVDDYIQALYRCQSPMDGKNECFTIDLNPGRAYNIIHSYIESNSSFQKYDINDEIKDFLNCVPYFESFGKELKEIYFEMFKSRVVDSSVLGNKFFPKSIINNDELGNYKNLLLKLGKLDSDGVVSVEKVKLDETQPDSGKNLKKVEKSKEDTIRESDEYQELMDKLMDNAEYLLERCNLLSLNSDFEIDNIDSIFDYLDKNEDKKDQYLEDLLID